MLQLTGYKKFYHSHPVLDIPLLNLQQGVYWLKGNNGAGKTTLLKSIAGLIPFDGVISVYEKEIRKHRQQYLRLVNHAEAEPVYPSFLSGSDLIHFYKHTKGGDANQIQTLIKHFDITSFVTKKISTYSSGMAKKLSLLLAFIGTPKLVLLDEPFITLDTKALHSLHKLIKDRSESGISFCISSHQELLLENFHTIEIKDQKAELL